ESPTTEKLPPQGEIDTAFATAEAVALHAGRPWSSWPRRNISSPTRPRSGGLLPPTDSLRDRMRLRQRLHDLSRRRRRRCMTPTTGADQHAIHVGHVEHHVVVPGW